MNKRRVLERAMQRMRRSELSRCFYLWKDRFGEVDDYARKRRKVLTFAGVHALYNVTISYNANLSEVQLQIGNLKKLLTRSVMTDLQGVKSAFAELHCHCEHWADGVSLMSLFLHAYAGKCISCDLQH